MTPLAAEAVWFTAPGAAEVRRSELGHPAAGEVQVETELSAISAGTEALVYRGQVPQHLQPDLATIEGSFGFPIKFGYACVGRVQAVGAAVSAPQNGQRVFAFHPHQSRFNVPVGLVVALPDQVESDDGLFFANLETAFNVVLDAHPRLGETVAVFGLGIVGLLVAALLRLAGVGRLIGVDPAPIRRQAASRLGVDLVLSADEASPAYLCEVSGGRGLDLAIEASGSPPALQAAIDAVAFQGTVVVCSWYGAKEVPLELGGSFHRRRVRLISSQVSNLDPSLAPRWDRRRRTEVVLGLLPRIRAGQLISHRFPLAEASTAYRLLDAAPESALQVVFVYSGY